MHDALWSAVIAAVPPTIVALATLVYSVKNHKAVREVHLAVNSRLDALLDATKKSSYAEGVKSELDKRIDRLAGDG